MVWSVRVLIPSLPFTLYGTHMYVAIVIYIGQAVLYNEQHTAHCGVLYISIHHFWARAFVSLDQSYKIIVLKLANKIVGKNP